jgi:hypothetical protein
MFFLHQSRVPIRRATEYVIHLLPVAAALSACIFFQEEKSLAFWATGSFLYANAAAAASVPVDMFSVILLPSIRTFYL